MKARPGWALVCSDKAYSLLLAAYPAEFRERYGPEMAQVFRTECWLAYQASGVGGLLRLWPAILWDWVWSAASERFSGLFRRSKVYHIHTRRSGRPLIPLALFLSSCLLCLFLNPFTWVFGEPLFAENAICRLEVDNQSGTTLRVTPLHAGPDAYAAVRLMRTSFPIFPTYQQRNISVQAGDVATLSYDCSHQDASALVACDPAGECYLQQDMQPLASGVNDRGFVVLAGRFTFASLDDLAHPDAALAATIQSFPQYNYTGIRNLLLCSFGILAVLGGFYTLAWVRGIAVPKHDL